MFIKVRPNGGAVHGYNADHISAIKPSQNSQGAERTVIVVEGVEVTLETTVEEAIDDLNAQLVELQRAPAPKPETKVKGAKDETKS